jgi:hypothetical protein
MIMPASLSASKIEDISDVSCCVIDHLVVGDDGTLD